MSTTPRYNYKDGDTVNNTTCPVCGGLGTPWRNWFSCEDPECSAIARVDTGEVFVKKSKGGADEKSV